MANDSLKIDVYTHVLPEEYGRRMFELLPKVENQTLSSFFYRSVDLDRSPLLSDIPRRLREMESVGDGYRQVLTLAAPQIEDFAQPPVGTELSRLANDGMAALVADHPERFVGFAAQLAMNDPDAAVAELERALALPGALGVQIPSRIGGRPIDHPDFEGVIAKVAEHDAAIWIHPNRSPTMPDYEGEELSYYHLFISIGWPYDTSLAVGRLIFSGIMERYPNLKVIVHHAGGMIPSYAHRIGYERAAVDKGRTDRAALTKPPVEYLRRLYADTAMRLNPAAVRLAIDFFGPEHVLFGTDTGFAHDPSVLIAELEGLGLPEADEQLIFSGNAQRIFPLVNV